MNESISICKQFTAGNRHWAWRAWHCCSRLIIQNFWCACIHSVTNQTWHGASAPWTRTHTLCTAIGKLEASRTRLSFHHLPMRKLQTVKSGEIYFPNDSANASAFSVVSLTVNLASTVLCLFLSCGVLLQRWELSQDSLPCRLTLVS